MAGFQLEDLLKDDKRDANLIPDLSKATCNSQEEFRRLMERCPEYKIKPEKVKRDDVRVRDKEFSWKATKRELRTLAKEWAYGDPIPPDMRTLSLEELGRVAIDWRMLTPLRPKLRQDEEMFSRLVEMGKLETKTIARERRQSLSPIRRSKNRAGIIESSVKICGECGEEFCHGESCGDILYDSFIRVTVIPQKLKTNTSGDTATILSGMDGSGRKGKGQKKNYNAGPRKKKIRKKSNSPRRKLLRGKSTVSSPRNNENKGFAGAARKSQDDAGKDEAKIQRKQFKRKCGNKCPKKK